MAYRVLCAGLALAWVVCSCGSADEAPSGLDGDAPGGDSSGGDSSGNGSSGRGGGDGGSGGSRGSEEDPSGSEDPDDTGESPSTQPPIGGDPEASTGCGSAPALDGGENTLEVGGRTRTFILDLPPGYDEDTPYPVVFGFHGRGFSAMEFRSAGYGNLLSAAGDDAIVVHPEADGAELAWDVDNDDDIAFFDALLDEVSTSLCVDEARVFAAGHSSGGYFTNLLGCRRGDVLRAIAPVAGGGPFGDDGSAPRCDGPVSAWIAHSENDETVLFRNGEGSLDHWLSADDCDEDRFEDVNPSPCVSYEGCRAGLAVNWCVYDDGHDWPSFAANGIWEFFSRF